jgi:hypothetical protein
LQLLQLPQVVQHDGVEQQQGSQQAGSQQDGAQQEEQQLFLQLNNPQIPSNRQQLFFLQQQLPHDAVQQLGSQHDGSQQAGSQQLGAQQAGSQHAGAQHDGSQQAGSQQLGAQQLPQPWPQQPPSNRPQRPSKMQQRFFLQQLPHELVQQVGSQHEGSQQAGSQHEGAQHDGSQQVGAQHAGSQQAGVAQHDEQQLPQLFEPNMRFKSSKPNPCPHRLALTTSAPKSILIFIEQRLLKVGTAGGASTYGMTQAGASGLPRFSRVGWHGRVLVGGKNQIIGRDGRGMARRKAGRTLQLAQSVAPGPAESFRDSK